MNTPKIKVYVAGPFFHNGERERIEKVRQCFSHKPGYELFFPMDHFIENGDTLSNWEWGKEVFKMDTKAIDESELIVAIYDKHYSDSGTAWEIGYAYSKGIPIILLCTSLEEDNSIMPIVCADCVYDFEKFVNDEYFEFDTSKINCLK